MFMLIEFEFKCCYYFNRMLFLPSAVQCLSRAVPSAPRKVVRSTPQSRSEHWKSHPRLGGQLDKVFFCHFSLLICRDVICFMLLCDMICCVVLCVSFCFILFYWLFSSMNLGATTWLAGTFQVDAPIPEHLNKIPVSFHSLLFFVMLCNIKVKFAEKMFASEDQQNPASAIDFGYAVSISTKNNLLTIFFSLKKSSWRQLKWTWEHAGLEEQWTEQSIEIPLTVVNEWKTKDGRIFLNRRKTNLLHVAVLWVSHQQKGSSLESSVQALRNIILLIGEYCYFFLFFVSFLFI